jgi:hypothetical protein
VSDRGRTGWRLRRNGLPPIAFYTIKQQAKEDLFCERKLAEICIFNKKQNGIRLKRRNCQRGTGVCLVTRQDKKRTHRNSSRISKPTI